MLLELRETVKRGTLSSRTFLLRKKTCSESWEHPNSLLSQSKQLVQSKMRAIKCTNSGVIFVYVP